MRILSSVEKIIWGLAILAVIIVGVFLVRTFLVKPSITINTSSASVVKQLQALNRYETAAFTIEKVIDAGTTGNTFQELLYGDRLLLIAHGQVIAGFDVASLQNEQVRASGDSIEVALPAPQILLTKLDGEKTRVYDRRTGIFTKGDKDLESQARLAAEQSIRAAACEEKILDKAAENAKKQLTVVLKSLGFTTVTITSPQGNC